MTEITTAIIPVIISAIFVGFYGAIKYYSKTLGTNPEAFDINKFLPIVMVSIVMAIIMSLSGAVTTDNMVEFLSANFTLVVFVDVFLTTYLRGKKSTVVSTPEDQLK